jgi:hypothetical protein
MTDNTKDTGAAAEHETLQEQQPDTPRDPKVEGVLKKLVEIGESGDKEAFLAYIEMLVAVNKDVSGLKLEKAETMTKDWFFECILKFIKFILPEALWLKWMISIDHRFLISRAMSKAIDQGLQINIAGKHVLTPAGEKKGRVYLAPLKEGGVNPDKLLVMIKEEYPVRIQRLLLNQNRLAELKGEQ